MGTTKHEIALCPLIKLLVHNNFVLVPLDHFSIIIWKYFKRSHAPTSTTIRKYMAWKMAAEKMSNQGEHGWVKGKAKVTVNLKHFNMASLPLTSPSQQENHSTGSLLEAQRGWSNFEPSTTPQVMHWFPTRNSRENKQTNKAQSLYGIFERTTNQERSKTLITLF